MPTKSRGRTAKALPKTKKFEGKQYKKSTCSKSKAEARKKAKAHRAKGTKKYARVAYDSTKKTYCVYTRG